MKISRASKKTSSINHKPFLRILKSAIIASGVSIVIIVVYSLLLYLGWLGISTVSIANTIIKVLGAVISAALAVSGIAEKRWLIGAASGTVYSIFAFLVFSVLSQTFTISLGLLLDIATGLFSGALTGMMWGVIKKR